MLSKNVSLQQMMLKSKHGSGSGAVQRKTTESYRQVLRCLKEVSSHTHAREVEKGQLVQLLEEELSLQKQQEDSIRALTEACVGIVCTGARAKGVFKR